jgi:cell wall-associated NlpC family hydrolase
MTRNGPPGRHSRPNRLTRRSAQTRRGRHRREQTWQRRAVSGVGLLLAVGIAVAAAALPNGSIATAASGTLGSDAVTDATTQAKQLQAEVSTLSTQAEVASEKYDAAQSELGSLVVQERAAQLRSTAAQAAASTDQDIVARRARALYMSGGTVGLYASILGTDDPDQIATGLHDLQALAVNDSRTISSVDASTINQQRTDADLSALLAKQDQVTAAVSDAAAQVQQSLATEQAALDSANATVLTDERALQAQLDAASAAAAAKTLSDAEAAAVAAGTAGMGAHAGPLAIAAITAAESQLGKPYVYGGSGPDSWDCSGLTQWAYREVGVDLPRTAAEQYAAVPLKVPLGQLVPGDLLFWATNPTDPSTIHHVAIYLGDGMMLAAPHTGLNVQVQPVYLDGYFGAVRPTA